MSGKSDTRINKNKDKIIKTAMDTITPTLITPAHFNNWSPANTDVLRTWKISLAKTSFIYQYVLDSTKNKLDKLLIFALILSVISTIFSGISTISLTVNTKITIITNNSTTEMSMNNQSYKTLALVINIILFVFTALISLSNGIIKIYKYDETVAQISSYIERLDQIYSVIANELILPDILREDAVTFIKRENDNYLKLLQQSPNIDKTMEHNAILKYNVYLVDNGNNFNISQKYNNDAMIEVI